METIENTPDDPKTKPSEQSSDTDPSVENGKKIIEIQKTIDKKSGEEEADDAEQWRNEG